MSDDKSDPEPERHSWFQWFKRAPREKPRGREQLIAILRESENRSLFDAETLSMLEGVLQVTELQVRHIMVPRAQMVVVEGGNSPEEFISIVTESAHSRFPIVGDSRDEVQGILLAKDLLDYFARDVTGDVTGDERGEFNIRDIMRPAVFIPESKRLNVLLREFRANRNHMAIVVDEYGGISGLVTIEDVLEQIVGEIDDEHDVDDAWYIRSEGDGEYIVKALTPIEEFNEYFHADFSDREFDTIGGVIVSAFGYLPRWGEAKNVAGFTFTVLRTSRRRVSLFKLRAL